ncbi:MAG: hypothetical protein GX878_10050, partial [Firmicutes bacterium]|nr:hypothetical protein [Bacillota bacterium]
QALREAGFSPPAGPVDLSAWDRARLSYNPAFRRAVLAVKRYGPASLQERLLLQSAILLLFCIAAQRILRRIPRGPFRATSFLSMLFVLLWMLLGLLKNLVTTPDLTRYCWFATYIPRHLLPVCWFSMCYVNKHNRLPSPKSLAALFGGASLLTVFVFTNDLHRLVFVYTAGEAAYWTDQYVNGWGYYLSLLWIFLLCLAGLALLTSKEWTRQQKRRLLYAGTLFLALLAYQLLYIAGVKHILDLDIPTTVAILFLVFNAAAQRERFMGASLLELPLFQNSPYAISIYDSGGQTVYRNRVMQSLQAEGALLPDPGLELEETPVIPWRRRLFKPHGYRLDQGRALLLEDITEIKQLERSLEETQIKLRAAQEILMRQAGESRSLTGRLEQERYSLQMDKLFREKLEEIQHQLGLLTGAEAGEQDHALLRRTRFLLCICQQRLRFIIRSLETHPILPAELIESYAAGVIRDGQRMGLDGVITCAVRGFCPPSIVPPLLHSIDSICLHAFHLPGASLICRLEAGEQGVNLNALLSQEGDRPFTAEAAPPGELAGAIAAIGGSLLEEAEEEGRLIRLHLPYREGEK